MKTPRLLTLGRAPFSPLGLPKQNVCLLRLRPCQPKSLISSGALWPGRFGARRALPYLVRSGLVHSRYPRFSLPPTGPSEKVRLAIAFYTARRPPGMHLYALLDARQGKCCSEAVREEPVRAATVLPDVPGAAGRRREIAKKRPGVFRIRRRSSPKRPRVRGWRARRARGRSMLPADGDNSTKAAESDMTSSLLCN
jgi:hypothetical protein